MLKELLIKGGFQKNGEPEPVAELIIKRGQVYSIVGFTGSGKSQLINDIEQMARGDTVSKRKVYLDSKVPLPDKRASGGNRLVAHLSQNMNFVMDMRVKEFLTLHATCRGIMDAEGKADDVIACANEFAGERIIGSDHLTRLSGGQSRALMLADIALTSNSPVVLIDEIENAGIDRMRAMETLIEHEKIVLIVTHDPLLALLGEKRIIMKNGGMQAIISLTTTEKAIRENLERNARALFVIQDCLRKGKNLPPIPLVFKHLEVAG